jgi:signal peptidase I
MSEPIGLDADKSKPQKRAEGGVGETIKVIIQALLIAAVVRTLLFQPFNIPSGSMIPTLLIGDHLLVNKLVYRFRLPGRGEVVVFKFPQDRKTDFIKRVVGLPGDDVELADGKLLVNGGPVADTHASYGPGHPSGPERFMKPFHVPRRGETVRLAGPNIKLYQLLVKNELRERGQNADVEVTDVQVGPDGRITDGRLSVNGKIVETWRVAEDYLFMMGDNRDNSYDSRFWGPVPRSDVVGKAMIIYWSFGNRIWHIRWDRLGHLIP